MSKKLRILLIEDDPTDFRLINRHLSRAGLDIETRRAGNASQLRAILENGDRWDIILTDYALPDIDIETGLSRLMERYPQTPIIMVSGTLGEERAVEMLKAGVEDFICKDNLSRLVPAILRALKNSEIRREKEASEARSRMWATAFEHAAVGIFITDPDCRILETNRAFSQIMGYPHDEIVGRTPGVWKSGHHDRDFYQSMWNSLQTTGQWRGEIRNRHRSGKLVDQWLTISAVKDDTGSVTHYVAMFSDISRLKETERQLEYLAHHDILTDLPNRMLFNTRLEQAIEHARRRQTMLAVLFLDLDRFKHINDSFGHAAGDALLKEVARRLRGNIRAEDTAARLGGDEFCLLLDPIHTKEDAATVTGKILTAFQQPFRVENQEVHVTPSIGISVFPRDGKDAATLFRNADAAMYQAKSQGSNGFAFYSKTLTDRAFEQVMLENALHKAIQNRELRLYFQPQVEMRTGKLIGAEALLRWEHPDMGIIPPSRFIPLAEETGLILAMGAWVFQAGCLQAKNWLDRGLHPGRLSLNVSGAQIRHGKLVAEVERALAESGLPPASLELEVTEGFIMEKAEHSIEILERLRGMGVSLAIDDFGTGYSSLSYLKRLPIQRLKIDQSFVRDIPGDPDDMAICRAVIALGRSMGLDIIAEGVETEAQRRFLLEHDCHNGQGFLFSRPLPPLEFERKWLSRPPQGIEAP